MITGEFPLHRPHFLADPPSTLLSSAVPCLCQHFSGSPPTRPEGHLALMRPLNSRLRSFLRPEDQLVQQLHDERDHQRNRMRGVMSQRDDAV